MVSSFCRKLLNQSKLACSLLWISYLLYTMQCCWNREWSRLSSFTLCPSLSSTCSPVQSKHTLSDQGYILVSTCFSIFLLLVRTGNYNTSTDWSTTLCVYRAVPDILDRSRDLPIHNIWHWATNMDGKLRQITICAPGCNSASTFHFYIQVYAMKITGIFRKKG